MPNTKISDLTAGNPALGTDQIPVARSGTNVQVTAASIAALSPAGTVTSVAVSGGTTGLTVTGSPVTSSGTITLSGTLAPANGGTGAIGTPSNGQLLIGNGTNYSVATLTAGSNVTITNSAGGITIAAASGVTTFSAGTTGLAPNTATAGAITLTGTLATTNGGTNLTSFTSGGAVYATSTSALTTGTLPLASGGTGQTTKAAAFNALSPVTTTGDLIIGNGTNSATRLAIGTNTYVLTSNGSTASWQPAAGGGGGVTSFDAGSTGLNPSGTNTGAITLSGTLNTGSGGTGTGSTPSNGQLLIGNGVTYSAATLTAGSGVTITNGSGSITIAAGAAGPAINLIYASTSSGNFGMSTPGSGYSRPLVGYTDTGAVQYGAFFFVTTNSGSSYSYLTVNSLQLTDTTGSFFNYSSGTDFFASSLNVNDSTVGCYNISLYAASLKTLFEDSSNALDANSLKPVVANNGPASTNPSAYLSMSGGPSYSCSSGNAILVSYVSAGAYYLSFASNNTTPATNFSTGYDISNITFNINGSSQSYSLGTDYTVSFWQNDSNGEFVITMTPINASLTTLLTNSAPGA